MLANKYLNTLAPTYLVTDFTFSYQYQTKMRCHTKMSTTHRRGSESFDVSNAWISFVLFQAEKEEKAIYLKCARRQLYVNVCVNLIKKLRDGSGCSKETDECNGGKRNPLAPKSSLPCPQKRLKIDTSVNNLLEDIPRPETVISTKTRTSLPNVDQEITGKMVNETSSPGHSCCIIFSHLCTPR